MFRVPYRWLPRTTWRNLCSCWSDVTNGVRNLWRWLPIIWFDADFDWQYIAVILEFKLRKHAEVELKYGHPVGSKRDGKNMLVCAELLRRLQADEYHENARKRFGRTARTAKFSQEQQKQDQRYLGLILGKYLTHWWD